MTGGTVGKSLFVTELPEEMLLNQRVAIIRNKWIVPEYLNIVIKAPHIISVINERKNSTNDNISMVDINRFLIPVPSLEHQRLIVTRYQELLPGVEKYGAAQQKLDILNTEIRERVRKSILQIAIQGKLVPQDSIEESSSKLVERVRDEKQKLLKEGKLRRKEIMDSIIVKGDDNKYYEIIGGKVLDISEVIPFEIPDSWQWVRLGYLFAHNTGKALNRADTNGVLKKYLTTSNVYWNRFDFSEVREMFFSDSEVDKCTIQKGDLLVCEGGDIGRAAIWTFDHEICIQNHIHKLRAYYPVSMEFYYYVFELYKGIGHIGGKGIGIQGLSSGAIHKLVLPLPPVQEQRRIVLKIREMNRFL